MDQQIKCAECGNEFTFTENDQQFYADKNYTPPRRCKPCRPVHNQRIGRVREDREDHAGYGE